ncbi:MAG: acetate kinase [bacterium]|nr:acetate kinase [bacterium]
MKVLSLNCGSSSLRWGLFDVSEERELASGAVEEAHDPASAWDQARPILEALSPEAVGHRVVHGGERFTAAARIDDDVLRAIEAQVPLAPVHNPRCLLGIQEARRIFPDLPHAAVFDTAFHQSLPPEAYLYALPYEYHQRDRIRRYGFHGTSHRHAAERAARLLDKAANAFTGIICHLGNGCSIAAVERGRSVDTSMGMTPLEGLMMGTRSGDVDPAVVLELAARPELGAERVVAMLNEESGLLGVSGVSSDLRKVEAEAASGHERARLAIDLFAHRVRRGIGGALAVLGSADAVVFTGGIGECGAAMRERIAGRLGGLGMELDTVANSKCIGGEGRISTPGSPVALFVIPACEEWQIARETAATLGKQGRS